MKLKKLYFLKYQKYKKYHKISLIENDWYEFVEYGTTNGLTIFLQKNGFSREASTYINYITILAGEYKLRNLLLKCQSKNVCREANEIKYNIPDLFVD